MPMRYLVLAPGALRVFPTAKRARTFARNYIRRLPGCRTAEVTRTWMNKAGVFRDYGTTIVKYEKCGRKER